MLFLAPIIYVSLFDRGPIDTLRSKKTQFSIGVVPVNFETSSIAFAVTIFRYDPLDVFTWIL